MKMIIEVKLIFILMVFVPGLVSKKMLEAWVQNYD